MKQTRKVTELVALGALTAAVAGFGVALVGAALFALEGKEAAGPVILWGVGSVAAAVLVLGAAFLCELWRGFFARP